MIKQFKLGSILIMISIISSCSQSNEPLVIEKIIVKDSLSIIKEDSLDASVSQTRDTVGIADSIRVIKPDTKKITHSKKVIKTDTITTENKKVSTNIPKVIKPKNGVYAPSKEELVAIQKRFKDMTLEVLNEGYHLYTEETCTKCHTPYNIYKRTEVEWKDILNIMAEKAKINDDQKNAVYKYVLAIKASQIKIK